MTSEALITTVTCSFALRPSSSTASLVIDEVTTWPPPISTRICEVVAPFLTSTTVPLIWLRALMRMADLMKLAARGDALQRGGGMKETPGPAPPLGRALTACDAGTLPYPAGAGIARWRYGYCLA